VIGITASFWVLPQNNNLGYTVMSVSTKEEFVCTAKPSSHPHSQWRPSCCWSSSERPHREPCTQRKIWARTYYSTRTYFKSLEEIVHFYNTRDVLGAGWLPPEVGDNINTAEMGNLGLNHGEELAIVAFLETLSDGYMHKK